MKGRELEIIKELMSQLQEEMQYGEEDLDERLERKKPGVEVVKIEGKLPLGESEEIEDMEADDMEDAMMPEMEEEFDPEEGSFINKKDPDEMLKRRLMKMRS